MAKSPPFRRVISLDEPALVGTQWWQDMVAASAPVDPEARRKVLRLTIGAGALVVGVGVVAALAGDSVPVETERVEPRDAFDLQTQHGWSLGSPNEALAFEGPAPGPVDRAALGRLVTDLVPTQAALRPFFVPTLFQSLNAQPTVGPVPGETPRALRDELRPVLTFPMRVAYSRGRALASLLAGAPPGKAIIVDLPGPEAVAFAAGLSEHCDPVFLFDNWPHPKGVVPSHLVLGAAWTFQPTFVANAKKRPERSPPAFILDRNRLALYTDSSDRFDNRYVARVPSARALDALWIKELLYVSPPITPQQELDDLNADFLGWNTAGLQVRMVRANDFDKPREAAAPVSSSAPPGPLDDGAYYYGGSYDSHYALWMHYGWGAPPRRVRVLPMFVFYPGWTYRVVRRPTLFSGSASGRRPASMGRVYVSASRTTGGLTRVGSRSGTFGRAGSSSGG